MLERLKLPPPQAIIWRRLIRISIIPSHCHRRLRDFFPNGQRAKQHHRRHAEREDRHEPIGA